MTKRVQLARGSSIVESAFVGLEGELRVDLDNDYLRLHDGVTPGGRVILNLNASNSMYQESSPELDGISGFAASDRGIMTRIGAGVYALRKITVNGQQLSIDNPAGIDGDFAISLKSTIATNHIFGGTLGITGLLTATGGVIGNVTGNLTGNVTGGLAGNVIGNLTGNSAGTHAGPQIGDVDVRGETLLLDNSQIPNTAIAGLVDLIKANGLPVGSIILWAGTVASIPVGWVLCDGANGTPDMRGVFPIGAGTLNPGTTGGSANHTHAAVAANNGLHSHAITVDEHILTLAQIPSHDHPNGVTDDALIAFNHGSVAANPNTASSIETNTNNGNIEGITNLSGGGLGHSHASNSTAAGTHTHAVTADNSENIPPYLALCFIMKSA